MLAALAATARAVRAQSHYYNLDAGRPLRIEDASVADRYELELQLTSLRMERLAQGATRWRTEPKLAYGIAPFTELEIRVPLTYATGRDGSTISGLAGMGVATMHAFNLETTYIPAIALSADALLPAGTLAPARTTIGGKALLTKTTRVARLHVNAAFGSWALPAPRPASADSGCGSAGCSSIPVIVDPPCSRAPIVPPLESGQGPSYAALCGVSAAHGAIAGARAAAAVPAAGASGTRYMVGAALDRSFPLRSMLVAASFYAEKFKGLYPRADWVAELGVRKQLTPQVVVDAGAARRFHGTFPSTTFVVGGTYSMALRAGGAASKGDAR